MDDKMKHAPSKLTNKVDDLISKGERTKGSYKISYVGGNFKEAITSIAGAIKTLKTELGKK